MWKPWQGLRPGIENSATFNPFPVSDQASDSAADPASPTTAFAAPLAPWRLTAAPQTTGGSTVVVSSPGGSGMVFNDSFDSTCTAKFEACVVAAEKTLEGLFTNPIVFNVKFTEQNQGNNGDAAENSWSSNTNVSYATLKNSLPGSDVLPATAPFQTAGLPEAYARMLGLSSSKPAIDDTVTYNTAFNGLFGQDVTNVLIHEMSEGLMGRVGGLGDQNGDYSTMDLFRYTATGAADLTDGRDGQTTFFSSNGGNSIDQSLSFNNEYNSNKQQTNTGDVADFTQQAVFGFDVQGETITLTQTELNMMAALGWKSQMSEDFFTASSGNWQTPTDWSSNVVDGAQPIEPQDAFIGLNGSAANATSLDDLIVNSIGTNAASSLTIDGASRFTATNGTTLNVDDEFATSVGNNGTIVVEGGSTLSAGGFFYNAGALTIAGVDSSAVFTGALNNSGSIAIGVGAFASMAGHVWNSGSIMIGAQNSTISSLGIWGLPSATTLSGGGAIELGQITVSILGNPGIAVGGGGGHIATTVSAGAILGAGAFVNDDNTITGVGSFSVGSLDNRSLTGIGATVAGYSVQIVSGTISNEGELFADAGATLELGLNSGAATFANSGRIDLAAGADLAISSNLTASGSGSIHFNGAGGALTSADIGPTTFTNANTIVATASAQIGDAGIKTANDLALIDTGAIVAENAGVTLTLNTGANTIVDRGGLFEAESGAQLTIDSAVQTGQFAPVGLPAPKQSLIEAASGGTVNVAASIFDGVRFASQLNGAIYIAGGTVNVAAGVSLGVPVAFSGAGGTLNLSSTPNAVAVNGSGGSINLTNAAASVTGNGFTITETGTCSLTVGGNRTVGGDDIVRGSGQTTTTLANSLVQLQGHGNTVNAGANDELALEGANDVLNLSQLLGETVVRDFAASDVIGVSHNDFANFAALQSHMTQSGANAFIRFDARDFIELTNVTAASLTAAQFHFT